MMVTRENWQCEKCNRLLGIFHDGVLHIKLKARHQYTVENGRVQAVCPNSKCRCLNSIKVPKVV